MQVFTIIGVLLFCVYLSIASRYFNNDINSISKLKSPKNAIRTINPKEKKYLTPHLKILNLSLVSDEVYQLDNAKISTDGYYLRGTIVSKMRANGIDISIPEPLEPFCEKSNTIEYVVAKFGMTIVAVAISINGENLLSQSLHFWKLQYDEKVLSTRYETVTEYRLRQNQEVYVLGAIIFFIVLVLLLCASSMKDLLWFNNTMLLSGAMLVLMLFTIIKRKLKIASPKKIEKVKGPLQSAAAKVLQNINIKREVVFIGLNHPYIIKDKKLFELAQNTYYAENLVTFELRPTKEGYPYELISLSDEKSIDSIYKNKIPRPKSRLIAFTLIALTGSIGFFSFDYSLLDNFAYARSYVLNNELTKPLAERLLNIETKNYRSVDDLIAQPPKFGDRIELSNIDNLDVVLRTEKGKFHIVENAIHINPREKYIPPVVPEILNKFIKETGPNDKINAVNFLSHNSLWAFNLEEYYDQNPITFPNDKQKEKKVKEEIVKYYENMYANVETYSKRLKSELLRNYFNMEKNAHKIIKPKRFVKLLDRACREKLPIPCDKLYEELAKEFSNPPNNYLAGLYETYQGETIPVEEFKKLLQQDYLLIMPRAIARFKSDIVHWAKENIDQIKENGKFDLTKNRGGVILTASEQSFASDYTSGFLSDYHGLRHWTITDEIAKIQKQSQSFEGVVTNISKDKDTLVINFIADRKYPYLQRQAIAVIIGGLVSVLVFLITLIGYLLPSFYSKPKADPKQTSGQLIN